MKYTYLIPILAVASVSAFAQLTPQYTIEDQNSTSVSSTGQLQLTDSLEVREYHDKYATQVSKAGDFIVTFNGDNLAFSLFEKADDAYALIDEYYFKDIFETYTDNDLSTIYIRQFSLSDNGDLFVSARYYTSDGGSDFFSGIVHRSEDNEFNSFSEVTTDPSLRYYNIIQDDGLALYYSENELRAYDIENNAQYLGRVEFNDIYTPSSVKVMPDTNTVIVTGYSYEWSEQQAVFAMYQYDVAGETVSVEKKAEILRSSDTGNSRRYSFISADQQSFLLVNVNNENGELFELNTELGTYEQTRMVDLSEIINHPHYLESRSASMVGNTLYIGSDSVPGLFSFDINTEQLTQLNVDWGTFSYRTRLTALDDELFFTQSGEQTKFMTLGSDVVKQLLPSVTLEKTKYLNWYSESVFALTGTTSMSFFDYSDNVLTPLYEVSLNQLSGNVQDIHNISETNSFLALTQGVINHISFDVSDPQNITPEVTPFPLLNENNAVDNRSWRAFKKVSDTQILLQRWGEFALYEKVGQTYRVVYTINSNVSPFDEINNISDLTMIGDRLYVVNGYAGELTVFALEDDEFTLETTLYDGAIFNGTTTLSETSLGLRAKTNNLVAVFDISGNTPSLMSTSAFDGVWVDTGNYYSVAQTERQDNNRLVFRQADPVTGIYNTVGSNDYDLRFASIFSSGESVGLHGTDEINAVRIVKLFDVARAPLALQAEIDIEANQGSEVSIELNSLFVEDDAGDQLTFSADTELDTIGLMIEAGILLNTDSDYYGTESFTLYATDADGMEASIDVFVDVNRRPQLIQPLAEVSLEVDESTELSLANYFYDDQDQTISYALIGETPEGVTLDDNGLLSIQIGEAGNYEVGIQATDSLGAVNETTLSVNITAPPPPPEPVQPETESGSSGGTTAPWVALLLLITAVARRRPHA